MSSKTLIVTTGNTSVEYNIGQPLAVLVDGHVQNATICDIIETNEGGVIEYHVETDTGYTLNLHSKEGTSIEFITRGTYIDEE